MWGYIIWGIILLIIISMLARMRSMFSVYVCPKCKTEFTLSPAREIIFPQVMYRKLIKCPNCKKFVAAGIIKNEKNISKLEQLEKDKQKRNNSKGRSGKKR